MSFVVGVVFIVIIILFVKYYNKNKQVEHMSNKLNILLDIINSVLQKFESEISSNLKPYRNPLKTKRKQLIYNDDYGDRITLDWEREIDKFINTKLEFLKLKVTLEIKDQFKEKYPYGTLEQWEIEFNNETIEEYVLDKLTEMIEDVAESSNYENDLEDEINLDDPYMFEKDIADIFIRHGWNARATKGSGDQGADVIAESKGGLKIIVQCKLYSQPVGNKAVQEVYSALNYYSGDYAFVITNSTFTKSAKQLADSNKVMLLHYSALPELLEKVNDSNKDETDNARIESQDDTSEEPLNDEMITYYDNGNIKTKFNHVDGVIQGEVTYYNEDGSMLCKTNYKDGLEQGEEVTYHGNGTILCKSNYVDGKKNGESITYDENGNIKSKGNYVDGELHGEDIGYNGDGTIFFKTNYVDGIKQGEETFYNENGTIFSKTNYVDGKKHGWWFMYDQDGGVRSKTRFENGVEKKTVGLDS